jgi:hypothetical protein
MLAGSHQAQKVPISWPLRAHGTFMPNPLRGFSPPFSLDYEKGKGFVDNQTPLRG